MEEKRGRGRPRKALEEDDRKLSEGRDKKDRKRTPIYESRDILTVPEKYKRPDKEHRFVRDYPQGNITRFLNAGWDFVIDPNMPVGDTNVDGNRAAGNVVSRLGDPKYGTMLYLMCIDKDLYDEDQKYKQEQLDELDKQLGTPKHGFYGKTDVAVGRGLKEPQ